MSSSQEVREGREEHHRKIKKITKDQINHRKIGKIRKDRINHRKIRKIRKEWK